MSVRRPFSSSLGTLVLKVRMAGFNGGHGYRKATRLPCRRSSNTIARLADITASLFFTIRAETAGLLWITAGKEGCARGAVLMDFRASTRGLKVALGICGMATTGKAMISAKVMDFSAVSG